MRMTKPHPLYKWAGHDLTEGKTWMTKDRDGDKVPNIIDCEPSNPKKQGFITHTLAERFVKKKKFIGKAIEKYRDYKEKQPEREEARIRAMKRRVAMEGERVKLERHRESLRKMRQRDIPPSFGMGLFGSQTPHPKPKARKKKKKKR